jgi:hypothetical protein
MSAPYSHDNLGEDCYPHGADPGTPDRYIDHQEAHDPFYSQNGPRPYPA